MIVPKFVDGPHVIDRSEKQQASPISTQYCSVLKHAAMLHMQLKTDCCEKTRIACMYLAHHELESVPLLL